MIGNDSYLSGVVSNLSGSFQQNPCMPLQRRTIMQILAFSLVSGAIPALAKKAGGNGYGGGNSNGTGRSGHSNAADGRRNRGKSVDKRNRQGRRLTNSQPPDGIIPLENILADIRPQQHGTLIGVRLVPLRGAQAYRLRVLKDSGGVVDIYVHAKTGARM